MGGQAGSDDRETGALRVNRSDPEIFYRLPVEDWPWLLERLTKVVVHLPPGPEAVQLERIIRHLAGQILGTSQLLFRTDIGVYVLNDGVRQTLVTTEETREGEHDRFG